MAQKDRCVHAYGLEIVRCPECEVQVGSLCRRCGYESRYDEDHLETCRMWPGPAGIESAEEPSAERTT